MEHGRLIGEGKVAEVFEYGERVLKLYRAGRPDSDARQEMTVLEAVAAAGVAAPRAYAVELHEGRWGLVMDRVAGIPFAEDMRRDMVGAGPYLAEMAKLQADVHRVAGVGLKPVSERLAGHIERASGVEGELKRKLLGKLAALPAGDRLLHGDFHPFNILGPLGSAKVIDWMDASRGDPAADACRSWVLLASVNEQLADSYLALYEQASGLTRPAIMEWLPVVAAARLAESVPNEEEALRRWATIE